MKPGVVTTDGVFGNAGPGVSGQILFVPLVDDMALIDAMSPREKIAINYGDYKISGADYLLEQKQDPTTLDFLLSLVNPKTIRLGSDRATARQRQIDRRAISLMRRAMRLRRR